MALKTFFSFALCCFAATLQAGASWQITDKQQNNDVFVRLQKPRLPQELSEVSLHEEWVKSLWKFQDVKLNPLQDPEIEADNCHRLHENIVLHEIWKEIMRNAAATIQDNLQARQNYADACLQFMAELAAYEQARLRQAKLMQESWSQSRH